MLEACNWKLDTEHVAQMASIQFPAISLTPVWRKHMEGIREQLAALADQILTMRRRL
jgi:hypothetical protein